MIKLVKRSTEGLKLMNFNICQKLRRDYFFTTDCPDLASQIFTDSFSVKSVV